MDGSRAGKTALVTGASSGMGVHYATQLASYGYNIVLVSNQDIQLKEVAESIKEQYNGIEVTSICKDLSGSGAAQELFDFCNERGIEVEVLVNNAGIFFFNDIIDCSIERIATIVNLHVYTVTMLCRLFGEKMRERRRGYILNMSSMSAWMAMPGIQSYNATKAFIYNFSKSLWYELKPKGVNITVMTPGAVDTALFGLAPNLRRLAVNLTVSIPPEKLVKRALRKMFRGKKADMPGVINHLATPLLKHTPDWLVFLVMKFIGKYQK